MSHSNPQLSQSLWPLSTPPTHCQRPSTLSSVSWRQWQSSSALLVSLQSAGQTRRWRWPRAEHSHLAVGTVDSWQLSQSESPEFYFSGQMLTLWGKKSRFFLWRFYNRHRMVLSAPCTKKKYFEGRMPPAPSPQHSLGGLSSSLGLGAFLVPSGPLFLYFFLVVISFAPLIKI